MFSLRDEMLDAASSGDLDRLKSLLQPTSQAALQEADLSLELLTGVAARKAQAQIVAYCITLGVELDSWDVRQGVLACRSLEVYKIVVPAGYDINHDLELAGDALIYAVLADKIDIVRYLLDNGADVNKHLQSGRYSALAVAAKRASPEMAELLISRGAAIDRSAAIMLAAELGRTDMVRTLIENGADLNVMKIECAWMAPAEEEEGSALHKAAVGDYKDIVELVLENGANVNLKDSLGRTALSRAEKAGNSDIVGLLRRSGAH